MKRFEGVSSGTFSPDSFRPLIKIAFRRVPRSLVTRLPPPETEYYENTDFFRSFTESLLILKSEYSASEGFLSLMNVETGFVTGTCLDAYLEAMRGSWFVFGRKKHEKIEV
jgi:hypothetical protein